MSRIATVQEMIIMVLLITVCALIAGLFEVGIMEVIAVGVRAVRE